MSAPTMIRLMIRQGRYNICDPREESVCFAIQGPPATERPRSIHISPEMAERVDKDDLTPWSETWEQACAVHDERTLWPKSVPLSDDLRERLDEAWALDALQRCAELRGRVDKLERAAQATLDAILEARADALVAPAEEGKTP